MSSFEYYCGMARATVSPHDIDYSTITVGYYTAQQIVEMASQITYVLTAATMTLGQLHELPAELYSTFCQRMRAGEIYYTRLDMRFRRQASNAVNQPIEVSLKRACQHGGMQIVLAHIDFASRATHVEAQLMMPLEG